MPTNNNANNFKNFILWGAILFPALVIANTILFRFMFAPTEPFFFILAAAIVVSWILMLTLYYVWAIYFYNINRGWTDKDWDDAQNNLLVQGSPAEPENNPNNDQTLGLPQGTVRGTIALSVLVGGMAMLVASLGMPGKLSQNEFLVDNFEYIKTAFLMVIAFYFGSKTLEFIDRKQVFKGPTGIDDASPSNPNPGNESSGSTIVNFPRPTESMANAAPRVIAGDISKGDMTPGPKPAAGDFEDPTAKG